MSKTSKSSGTKWRPVTAKAEVRKRKWWRARLVSFRGMKMFLTLVVMVVQPCEYSENQGIVLCGAEVLSQ
jgi:hypothetical protein